MRRPSSRTVTNPDFLTQDLANLPDQEDGGEVPYALRSSPYPTAADLGKLVRKFRLANRLRQDELAGYANVGTRFVVDLEAGKPTIQLGKALQVLAILGCKCVVLPPGTSTDGRLTLDPEIAARLAKKGSSLFQVGDGVADPSGEPQRGSRPSNRSFPAMR